MPDPDPLTIGVWHCLGREQHRLLGQRGGADEEMPDPSPPVTPRAVAEPTSAMTHPTTLADWLAHCERLHPKQIDMTLARTRTLIERLGLKFAMPVVSVAGTNGKGSTCAMLEAIALAA